MYRNKHSNLTIGKGSRSLYKLNIINDRFTFYLGSATNNKSHCF